MNEEERKAAVSGYRERKVEFGIYSVRCTPSGQVWVGSAPDLSTIQNRIWFTLRQGNTLQRSLQEAWDSHGAGAFVFDVVERIDVEDVDGGWMRRLLRDRLLHWTQSLQAARI